MHSREFAIGLIAVLVLSISSWVSFPLGPVPVTLQTATVMLIGALLGATRASMVLLVWLGAALVGAPLLAGGASGVASVFGSTSGYLLGFFPAAAVASRARGPLWRDFSTFFAAHLIILACGGAWLAIQFGPSVAWTRGVAPFFLGAVAKSLVAALVLVPLRPWAQRWHLGQK